ncbi:MAG: FG-GAP repeat protein [Candidatus Edwardsbacteria bacterium]|nr:FG-GAP repeat protein [Candidatus Edwardsbacteria bacterium]
MRKLLLISCLLAIAYGLSPAQTTYNLDIIWQKASPDTGGGCRYWGYRMAGGDLNGDGYSDFVSSTDTVIDLFGWIKSRVYIFLGGPALSTVPSQIITYDTTGSHQPMCIADFNNDGYGDLALGDAYGTGVNETKGCVNIHYGTGVDLNSTPDLVIGGYNGIPSTAFGTSLSAGDINGDGIDDLVVGAPSYPISGTREGRVYVYYGDTLGLNTFPDIIINGHSSPVFYEEFGASISSVDDYNGDGYDDLLIGAYGSSINGAASGAVYFYYGSAKVDTISYGWVYGENNYQLLGGFNVSTVESDTIGYNAIGWFGTPFWPTTTGTSGEGKCYLLPGDTIDEIAPLWTITGEDTALGFWSSSAGYADGDKLGDFLAGASPAFNGKGKAYLWLRRPLMKNIPDAYILGRYSGGVGLGDELGARVALAGDVDGCGRDEFLVSNYYADSSHMVWLCKYTGPDGVEQIPDDRLQMTGIKLGQNYPNPFNKATVISYQATGDGPVKLAVYNIAGQLVKTLTPPSPPLEGRDKREGSGSVTWDGRDDNGRAVANGVYVYKLNAGGQSISKKMIVIK